MYMILLAIKNKHLTMYMQRWILFDLRIKSELNDVQFE